MKGIISYIRTVGSRKEVENINSLLEMLEYSQLSLEQLLAALQGIDFATLPLEIRNKLLRALRELEAIEIEDQLRAHKKLSSSDNQAIAQFNSDSNRLNSLVHVIHRLAVINSDLYKDISYIDRINTSTDNDYEPVVVTADSTLLVNSEGQMIIHIREQDFDRTQENYFQEALKLMSSQDENVKENMMAIGAIQFVDGENPTLNDFSTCKLIAKQHGATIDVHSKLRPIPKGVQREHLIPHSCMFGEYRQKGQPRNKVTISKEFGDYLEDNALSMFVDDAQKHGTEHRALTNADRDFAKDLRNKDGQDNFATLKEWIEHKEKALKNLFESDNLKRTQNNNISNRLDHITDKNEKERRAGFTAKAIMQATKIHMHNLRANLNAPLSNRIALGEIPSNNLIKDS